MAFLKLTLQVNRNRHGGVVLICINENFQKRGINFVVVLKKYILKRILGNISGFFLEGITPPSQNNEVF